MPQSTIKRDSNIRNLALEYRREVITSMVFLAYACAAVLALALLYCFHAHWYWHVLSVVLAVGLGMVPAEMIPIPAAWGVIRDVTVGCVFLFLIVWGLGAPLFRRHHQTPHATPQA